MKVVLFDLGKTLEMNDALLPGARETLEGIRAMRDFEGNPPALSLVSDFDMPAGPEQVPLIRQQYFEILNQLGIREFFEPVSKHVTLSTEVGVFKPDRRIFKAAVDKLGNHLSFGN